MSEKDSAKRKSANELRLETLHQRRLSIESKKHLVSEAIRAVDKDQNQSRHIKFESDESAEEEEESNMEESESRKRPMLFDSDSEGQSEADFGAALEKRLQMTGPTSAKVLKMELGYGNDPRFRLTDSFLPDAESKQENELPSDMDDGNEKKKNLSVLEKIIGQKMSEPDVPPEILKRNKANVPRLGQNLLITRFDPGNESHKQFEVKDSPVKESSEDDVSDDDKNEETQFSETLSEPGNQECLPASNSCERSFDINSDFVEQLRLGKLEKTPVNEPFSLLRTFGRLSTQADTSVTEEHSTKLCESPILLNKVQKNILGLQAGVDTPAEAKMPIDSCSESDGSIEDSFTPDRLSGEQEHSQVRNHSFFFSNDDERIKEAITQFRRRDKPTLIQERWERMKQKVLRLPPKSMFTDVPNTFESYDYSIVTLTDVDSRPQIYKRCTNARGRGEALQLDSDVLHCDYCHMQYNASDDQAAG